MGMHQWLLDSTNKVSICVASFSMSWQYVVLSTAVTKLEYESFIELTKIIKYLTLTNELRVSIGSLSVKTDKVPVPPMKQITNSVKISVFEFNIFSYILCSH